MKVVFASQSFYPYIGGVSTYLVNLATGLQERGHEVAEIHLRPPYEESEEAVKGINVTRVPKEPLDQELLKGYSRFKEAIYKECHGHRAFGKPAEKVPGFEEYCQINQQIGKQVAEALDELGAQVVHVHDFQLLFLYKYVPRGIPLVFTWHVPFPRTMSRHLSTFLVKHLAEFDQVVFSTNEYIRDASKLGLPRRKTAQIYPLANTEHFKPGKKTDFFQKKGLPQNAKVVLCVQRVDPKSGHKQLINAMPALRKRVPEAHLVFVGSESLSTKISPERAAYVTRVKKLIRRKKLGSFVHFIGNVDYELLPEAFNSAHVVTLCSRAEGFGLSITEGMACAKPVLGTRTTGIKEQVKHGKNGYLVPVGGVKQTASFLSKLLLDKSMRKRMGAQALKTVKKRFLMEYTIDKHVALYNALLQEKSERWGLDILDPENVHALVTDFDRTLTARPGVLRKQVVTALRAFSKPIVLATGRRFAYARPLARKHRVFSAVVCENGAVCYFPGTGGVLRFDSEPMSRARTRLRKKDWPLSFGDVIVSAPVSYQDKILRALGKEGEHIQSIVNVDRVMFLPKGVDKGTGVEMVLRQLDIDPEKTVVIGDAENDRELFNVPGFRVAVANAVPELKAIADEVVEKPSYSGVLEVLSKLKTA